MICMVIFIKTSKLMIYSLDAQPEINLKASKEIFMLLLNPS